MSESHSSEAHQRTAPIPDAVTRSQNATSNFQGPSKPYQPTAARRTQALIDDLLQVANEADRVSEEAARIEHIPAAMRMSIIDRVAQLSYMIRLLARQVDLPGGKTMNTPVEG